MADDLLEKEPALIALPGKPLSIDLLDEGRKAKWATVFIPDLLEFTSSSVMIHEFKNFVNIVIAYNYFVGNSVFEKSIFHCTMKI